MSFAALKMAGSFIAKPVQVTQWVGLSCLSKVVRLHQQEKYKRYIAMHAESLPMLPLSLSLPCMKALCAFKFPLYRAPKSSFLREIVTLALSIVPVTKKQTAVTRLNVRSDIISQTFVRFAAPFAEVHHKVKVCSNRQTNLIKNKLKNEQNKTHEN